MSIHGDVEKILGEQERILADVPEERVREMTAGIEEAAGIFCAAQGRSGYILRCFCMRLMHLGYEAYFVGETITPPIGADDVLVVVSGSGGTPLTREWVDAARRRGAKTYGIVGIEDSPIGEMLDCTVCIPAGTKHASRQDSFSIQPPGSLFEQGAFVLLEAVVLSLYRRRGSDPHRVRERHANLE